MIKKTDKSRTPVIIGASQYTQPKNTPAPLDPIRLMCISSGAAIKDSGREKELRELIDAFYIINIWGWTYQDPASELTNALGLNPAEKYYSEVGGNIPQYLVTKAARAIAGGESRAVLITGGESEYSMRRAKREGIKLNWPEQVKLDHVEKMRTLYISDFEKHYGMIYAIDSYALIETALRHASGWDHREHFSRAGKLLERYTTVASKNPFSWSNEHLTAEEISAISADNRYLNYPFVKRFVSNIGVDQSAAVIITNEEIADRLGIAPERRVYPMGGADIENIFYLIRRPGFYDSPPLKEASRLSLEQAGFSINDITAFEIYSCFPCMIEIARREIGIPENDPRPLTVTGGLPFFGGPFSSYTLHAIVSAVDTIRSDPSQKIMVQANGGINTKQSIGVYGSAPSVNPWTDCDDSAVQKAILKKELPEPVIKAGGRLTVLGYTMYFDRQGKPEKCIAIGELENGTRAVAFVHLENKILEDFERIDLVGMTGDVSFDPWKGHNFIKIKA